LLVAAVGATCCAGVLLGMSDAFVWGNLTRVAFPAGIGLLLVGIGLTAMAWDLSQVANSKLAWVPIGTGLFVATARLGLWQALMAQNQAHLNTLPNLTFFGGLTFFGSLSSAVIFG